jgi:hypothetical protein
MRRFLAGELLAACLGSRRFQARPKQILKVWATMESFSGRVAGGHYSRFNRV